MFAAESAARLARQQEQKRRFQAAYSAQRRQQELGPHPQRNTPQHQHAPQRTGVLGNKWIRLICLSCVGHAFKNRQTPLVYTLTPPTFNVTFYRV